MTRKLLTAAVAAFIVAACNAEPARTGPAAEPAAPGAEATGRQPVTSPEGVAVDTAATDAAGPSQPAGPDRESPAPPSTQPVNQQAGRAAPAVQEPPQQAADEGAAVLQRASAAYEGVRSLRADFTMTFENPLLRQTTTSRGTIYQRQPDRIALRFSEPDGDLILSDGQHFWVYYPSVNAQQVIRSPASAGGESGVNLQAQFVGNPVERFRYELHGTEAAGGRSAHVLTLVPRQRAEYRSLKVWVDSRDGLVRRFELTEHNGNVRRFDLQNLQVNPAIQESVFRFTPPAGARIVDAG
jgi:outer membrane lipoprotein carrier protein